MSWGDIISIANIIVTIVLAGGVLYIGNKTSKIDQLESALSEKAKELIDQKFATVAAELKNPITELATIVREIKERLANGDKDFDTLGHDARRLELQISKNREWAMEKFAERAELDRVVQQLHRIEIALGHCQKTA